MKEKVALVELKDRISYLRNLANCRFLEAEVQYNRAKSELQKSMLGNNSAAYIDHHLVQVANDIKENQEEMRRQDNLRREYDTLLEVVTSALDE